MSKRRVIVTTLMVAVLGAPAGLGGVDASTPDDGVALDEPIEVNIGVFPVVSPVPVMQDLELLEQYGIEVNWVPVQSGLPGAASALAAGRLDFVHANSSSGTIIFSNEPEVAYFVGRSFINLNETVVSADSDIESIADLGDRTVVVSGLKTASTLFYELGLRREGVTPDRDKYFVAGTGPGMVDVLAVGGTEVAATYVPYSSEMERRGAGEVLFTASDALGRTEPGDGFIVSRAFAEEHPDAVVAVLRALDEAMTSIADDPEAYYETIAEFAGVPVETIEHAFGGDIVPPSIVPDVEAMIEVGELAEEYGFAPEGVEGLGAFAEDFGNPSFAETAVD